MRIGFKVLSVGLMASVLLNACKKKKEPETPEPAPYHCTLYTTVSTDTNYIPHKKNSSWNYCPGTINMADWNVTISRDTVIGAYSYFDKMYHTNSSHAGTPNYSEKYRIDGLGNYYRIDESYWSTYVDTLLIIKVNAANGDTIYNNPLTHNKVILINRNEAVGSLTACYHTLEIYGANQRHHYYKKGLGELYFNGFTLSNAIIR